MSTSSKLTWLKTVPGLLGLLSAGVLVGVPALAQIELSSSGESNPEAATQISQVPEAGSEVEISDEGMEILCERFPLNSRCSGEAIDAEADSLPSNEGDDLSDDQLAPETSPSLEPPSNEMNDGLAPGSVTPEPATPSPNGSLSPDGTLSPDSPAPNSTLKSAIAPAVGSSDADLAQIPPSAPPPAAAPPAPAPDAAADETPADAPVTPEADPTAEPVTDAELQQFANVIPQLQEIEEVAQQQIAQTIDQSGLSRERFGELYRNQRSPEAGAETAIDATPEEQESFREAVAEIQSLEQDIQSQQVEVLQSQGLEPERFNQILAAVRQDPALQQQIQTLLQAPQ